MTTLTHSAPATALWTGRAMTGLVGLFLTFDGTIKVLDLPIVRETMVQLGYSPSLDRGLGVMILTLTALYLFPRTAVLGAVLLTGLYGGAIATQLRVGAPIASHLLFGVYLGLLTWGGLYLRDGRLRGVFPVRRDS